MPCCTPARTDVYPHRLGLQGSWESFLFLGILEDELEGWVLSPWIWEP